MRNTDIATLVSAALEAEFHHYRNAELQHITAVNDDQHGKLKPLPVPTDDESLKAYKDREFSWMRHLFGRRLDLDYSAGLLLGFSRVMTEHAIFVADKSNLKLPLSLRTRPISGVLVKAFADMRDAIANSDINKPSITTYAVGDLIEWAKGKDFVADEVLAEWEAYNKAEAGESKTQAAPAAPGNEPKPKPLQRWEAQDAVILNRIRDLGYERKNLPKNPPGKPGVKALIKNALKGNELFIGDTTFKKAWERLTERGDIVIAKVSP